MYMGPFNLQATINDIDNNIYWNSEGKAINFRKMTFEQWQSEPFRHDINSFIIDPLFVNLYRENGKERDFNFKSNEAYSKIGFKPFTLTFGVVNDKKYDSPIKSWIDVAKDHKYTAYFERPTVWQLFDGFEDFEHGFSAKFWNRSTITPGESTIEITTENLGPNSDKQSLKLGPISSSAQTKPSISIRVDYSNCKAEISLDAFIPEDTNFEFGLGDVSTIQFCKGAVQYFTGRVMKQVGNFPTNQWINIKFNNNYGSERTEQTTLITVRDYSNNTEVQMTSGIRTAYSSVTNFVMILSESVNNVYIDNLNFLLDRKADKQFEKEFAKTQKLTSIYHSNEDKNKDDGKKKNNTGLIIGVLIAVIVVIAVVAGFGYWYYKKHRSSSSGCQESMPFVSL